MPGFGLGEASELKVVTSDQVAQWNLRNVFFPFGPPKIIVVDADGLFAGIFKKTFQETLLILVHGVSRGNHKEIIN